MKRIFIFMLILISICSIAFAKIEYPYPDLELPVYDRYGKQKTDREGNLVFEPHKYLRDITILTKIGLIDGYEDGTFKPENPITRAEYIKMVMILATNRSFDFENVYTEMDHWVAPYLVVAELQGVVGKGEYTIKNIDEPITRIEMVCILSRIQINMKSIEQNRAGTLKYTDIGSLDDKQKELLLHAAKYVLLDGMLDSDKFEPNKFLNRGEATASIMRIY